MLTTAITTCITFLVLFVVMAVVVRAEEIREKRFFLSGTRQNLDKKLLGVHTALDDMWHHFVRYIVQLGWYYSMHSLLKTILRVLVSVYTYIEHIFEKNRQKTKVLRKEWKQKTRQTHLTQIADHKAETALSSTEKATLRQQKLEEDH
ncbi:MAG: hypothetical protein KBC62_00845 [Candidatus Pacebacteria bacterium]|nr:hypothetical protein [Candidatus Paceibacterota bacterium]MBP9842529.1 hypothetical protein [Candidatus Paceibacterota bacterium]